jgi:polyisoprenoid-binding protein YceI
MFLSLAPTLTFAASLLFMLVANTQQSPVVAPVVAPTTAQTTQNKSAADATVWKIDDTHSMGLFRVQHSGAGMFWGRFDGVTGIITTSGIPSGTLALDVSIDTNSVSSANKDLDGHLRSPDFFSVKEFPTMTFVSTSSKKLPGNMWEVSGNLTMHGVTKLITTNVEMTGQAESPRGKKIGFEAVFTIDRSEFGMSYGVEKNAIGNSVRITVALEAGSS